jgi:hypothetical protein
MQEANRKPASEINTQQGAKSILQEENKAANCEYMLNVPIYCGRERYELFPSSSPPCVRRPNKSHFGLCNRAMESSPVISCS